MCVCATLGWYSVDKTWTPYTARIVTQKSTGLEKSCALPNDHPFFFFFSLKSFLPWINKSIYEKKKRASKISLKALVGKSFKSFDFTDPFVVVRRHRRCACVPKVNFNRCALFFAIRERHYAAAYANPITNDSLTRVECLQSDRLLLLLVCACTCMCVDGKSRLYTI